MFICHIFLANIRIYDGLNDMARQSELIFVASLGINVAALVRCVICSGRFTFEPICMLRSHHIAGSVINATQLKTNFMSVDVVNGKLGQLIFCTIYSRRNWIIDTALHITFNNLVDVSLYVRSVCGRQLTTHLIESMRVSEIGTRSKLTKTEKPTYEFHVRVCVRACMHRITTQKTERGKKEPKQG